MDTNELLKRFENGEWLSEKEIEILAKEEGEWIKEVYEEDKKAEEEHKTYKHE